MNWLIFLAFFRNLLFKMGNSSGKKSLLTKNKRGWLLIMEAFISIMFLLGFSIYMIQKQTPKVDISEEIQKQARYIIKAAAHDNDVRNAVIGRNNCSVKNFVYQQLKQYAPYLDYHVKLCDPGMSCRITYGEKQDYKAKGIDLEKKEIYADDYLFSANLTVFRPTVLKLFLWMSEKGPSVPFTFLKTDCFDNDVYNFNQCDSEIYKEKKEECNAGVTWSGITYITPEKCVNETGEEKGCESLTLVHCYTKSITRTLIANEGKTFANCMDTLDNDCDGLKDTDPECF